LWVNAENSCGIDVFEKKKQERQWHAIHFDASRSAISCSNLIPTHKTRQVYALVRSNRSKSKPFLPRYPDFQYPNSATPECCPEM
jgi:hypothetical protein